MQRSPGVFTAGTIYGQLGTAQIVGAGTSWMVADGSGSEVSNIAPFDMLWIDGQSPLLIKSIEDDQHLTLGEKLPFGIPAGTSYTIIKSTVTPSAAVQGLLQKILALGTSASPLTYEAFDNGANASFQIGFAPDGRVRLRVGGTGADGSPQNPWHDALLIDPATGNVTATGLGTNGTGSANRFWYITGKPPNAIGVDGDVNFDFVSGFVVYVKAAGIWGAGLDVLANLSAAVDGKVAAAQSAAALAQGWSSTAEDTDVSGAQAGSRSAFNFASKAAKALASVQALIAGGGLLAFNAVQALTSGQQAQALTNLGAIGNLDGCCRLFAGSTTNYGDTLNLLPFNGSGLVIGGKPTVIPDVGLSFKVGAAAPGGQASILTGQAPTAGRTYYVYAFLDGSGVGQIELSATAYSVGVLGMRVKSGDPTRRLVAIVFYAGPGPGFASQPSSVLNFFNRRDIRTTANTGGFQTASRSNVTAASLNFMSWAEEGIEIGLEGTVNSGDAGQGIFETLYVDTAALGNPAVQGQQISSYLTVSGAFMPAGGALSVANLVEGWHAASLAAYVGSGNACTLNQILSVKTRG